MCKYVHVFFPIALPSVCYIVWAAHIYSVYISTYSTSKREWLHCLNSSSLISSSSSSGRGSESSSSSSSSSESEDEGKEGKTKVKKKRGTEGSVGATFLKVTGLATRPGELILFPRMCRSRFHCIICCCSHVFVWWSDFGIPPSPYTYNRAGATRWFVLRVHPPLSWCSSQDVRGVSRETTRHRQVQHVKFQYCVGQASFPSFYLNVSLVFRPGSALFFLCFFFYHFLPFTCFTCFITFWPAKKTKKSKKIPPPPFLCTFKVYR